MLPSSPRKKKTQPFWGITCSSQTAEAKTSKLACLQLSQSGEEQAKFLKKNGGTF